HASGRSSPTTASHNVDPATMGLLLALCLPQAFLRRRLIFWVVVQEFWPPCGTRLPQPGAPLQFLGPARTPSKAPPDPPPTHSSCGGRFRLTAPRRRPPPGPAGFPLRPLAGEKAQSFSRRSEVANKSLTIKRRGEKLAILSSISHLNHSLCPSSFDVPGRIHSSS
ncbi:hypothetical protein SAMN05920897_1461, partial [Alkalispirochaeta americana]